tara:strand:- start:179 stop:439 length:261 start_codon:yes stop_codon:yes gene_type:complete
MKKELKYLLYIITIFVFFIFIGSYYFSDKNKKNSYRSLINYDENINLYKDQLNLLKNDTDNIIEYVENKSNTKKSKYNFWNLIQND